MNGDPDIQRQLESELDPGEKIVWQEKAKRFAGQRALLFPLIFLPLWFIFIAINIAASEAHVHVSHPTSPFPVSQLPIGIFLLFAGGIFVAQCGRFGVFGQSYYLITDRRAMIIRLGKTRTIKSFFPGKLQSLELIERAQGHGDIVIDHPYIAYGNRGVGLPATGFINIANVRAVSDLLHELAAKALPRG